MGVNQNAVFMDGHHYLVQTTTRELFGLVAWSQKPRFVNLDNFDPEKEEARVMFTSIYNACKSDQSYDSQVSCILKRAKRTRNANVRNFVEKKYNYCLENEPKNVNECLLNSLKK